MKKTILAILLLATVGLSAQRTVRYSMTSTGTVQGADVVATDDLTVGDDATISGDLTAYKHVLVTEYTSTAGAGFDTQAATAYAINLINSSGDTVNVTPPTSPVAGMWFTVVQSRSTSAKPVYITTTTDKLRGAAANVTLSASLPAQRLVYVNSTVGWVPEN